MYEKMYISDALLLTILQRSVNKIPAGCEARLKFFHRTPEVGYETSVSCHAFSFSSLESLYIKDCFMVKDVI